jgi:hypothetical protein
MKGAPCPSKTSVATHLRPPRGHASRRPRRSCSLAAALLLALLLPAPHARFVVAGDAGLAEGKPATSVEGTQTATHWAFLPLVSRLHRTNMDERFAVQMYVAPNAHVNEANVAGVGRVRIPLIWAAVEPTNTSPSEYQWPAAYEAGLARLTASGMDLILTVDGNPKWAATYAGGPIDLVPISEFVDFVTAAVARYSAPPYNVKLWEFYNEPDNGDLLFAVNSFLGYWGHTPDLYAEMLAAVYQPIKKVDPEAQVLIGGLAHDWDGWWEEDYDGPFVREFLDGVLQAGGGAYFDMLNFHFYPTAFAGNWTAWGPGLIGKTTYLRQKLASYGLYKPVICSELAVESAHGGTEEIQSRYVALIYAQAMATDLVSLSWFMLVDEPPEGYWRSGLLYYDLTRKPAFYAYQTAVARLGHATYLRALSTAEKGTDAMEAYQFLTSDGKLQFIVGWTNDELSHVLTLIAPMVTVVDKYGTTTVVYDQNDGVRDGRTHVTVTPSPVYLYPAQ